MGKSLVIYMLLSFNPIIDSQVNHKQVQLHPALGVVVSVNYQGVIYEYAYAVLETNYVLECSFFLTSKYNVSILCDEGTETVVRSEPTLYRQRDSVGNWTEWRMWTNGY